MPTFTPHYNLAKPLVNNPVDEDVWGNETNDNWDIVDNALYNLSISMVGGTPSGAITDFAGSVAPSGWLLCFGQAVSRTTYATLFGVIGTTYGAGDGATTFNLPDCRGRVNAGKDDMGGTPANRLTGTPAGGVTGNALGNTGGAQGHALTIPQLASHSHILTVDNADVNGALTATSTNGVAGTSPSRIAAPDGGTAGQPVQFQNGRTDATVQTTYTITGSHTHTATAASAGSGDQHNNVQPTIIFNKIIKE